MKKVILLSIIFILQKCIAVTSLEVGDLNRLNIKNFDPVSKRTILLESDWDYTNNGQRLSEDGIAEYKEKGTASLKTELNKYNLFNVVTEGNEFNYKLKTKYMVARHSSFAWDFFSAITLLIVPTSTRSIYKMFVELSDANGTRIAKFTYYGNQELFFELFLILVAPFNWFLSDENNVYKLFARSAIYEVYDKVRQYENQNKSKP
ncbi:hypothetical protein [Leptospira langatensis]|nr:hypothetical protein [Leptospira langatensis]TGK01307.1 hypothetical protein EHO57_10250 [Leptospira langatensis]